MQCAELGYRPPSSVLSAVRRAALRHLALASPASLTLLLKQWARVDLEDLPALLRPVGVALAQRADQGDLDRDELLDALELLVFTEQRVRDHRGAARGRGEVGGDGEAPGEDGEGGRGALRAWEGRFLDRSTIDRFLTAVLDDDMARKRKAKAASGDRARVGAGAGADDALVWRSGQLGRWYALLRAAYVSDLAVTRLLEDQAVALGRGWRLAHVAMAAMFYLSLGEVAGDALIDTVAARLTQERTGGKQRLSPVEAVAVLGCVRRLGWRLGDENEASVAARAREVQGDKLRGEVAAWWAEISG